MSTHTAGTQLFWLSGCFASAVGCTTKGGGLEAR